MISTGFASRTYKARCYDDRNASITAEHLALYVSCVQSTNRMIKTNSKKSSSHLSDNQLRLIYMQSLLLLLLLLLRSAIYNVRNQKTQTDLVDVISLLIILAKKSA